MIAIITILILLTCVVLGFFVLIQNPKGGGLSGTFGSISSQVMGVKQSTDVMEKGTWVSIGVIAALCVLSIMFASKPQRETNGATAKPASSQSAPKGGKTTKQ